MTPDEQRMWLLREMEDEFKQHVKAEERGDERLAGFKDGCVDGYVRAGWHFGLLNIDRINSVLEKKEKDTDGPTIEELYNQA